MGTLYYGDNLDILRRYLKDESVDLVYLDPPFNSAQNYNAFFQEKDGTAAASQIRAFEDTWTWNQESQRVYEELILQPGKVSEVMQAFKTFLGTNDMMAYLAMMCPRLVELRRVLKPTGSLYLHCDPTASHYLKILCDAILGKDNFRNEIIWKRSNPKSLISVNFATCTDTILRFTKTDKYTYHQPYEEHDPDYVESAYKYTDKNGRYRLLPLLNPNDNRPNLTYEFLGVKRVWRWTKERMQKAYEDGVVVQLKPGAVPQYKKYLADSKGRTVTNCWTDIPQAAGNEALGYPTQKPIALLERILEASTNPGDVVLDPFCGCGTTIDAAEKLGRDWIGIDVTQLAISLIKNRLQDTYGRRMKFESSSRREPAPSSPPEKDQSGLTPAATEKGISIVRIIGEPTTPNEAAQLAEDDKYQFQWWALGLVGARPVEQKKGADHGIDGKILFRDDLTVAKPEQIIIQVKGGKTGVKDVRDLRGVLDREKAAIGLLISLQPATSPMEAEAASAGFYEHKMNKQKYPRLQLRTVKELMDGKTIERPSNVAAVDETFKKAPKTKAKGDEQLMLVANAIKADFAPLAKRLEDILKIKDDTQMQAALKALLAEWPEVEAEVRKNKNTAKALEKILGEAFLSGLKGERQV
jgi:DNA modification methylase